MLKKLLLLLQFLSPSPVKKVLLRCCGAKIGRSVRLPVFCVFDVKRLVLGDGCHFRPFTFIRAESFVAGKRVHGGFLVRMTAREIEIGDDTFIGERFQVYGVRSNPHAVFRAGKRVSLGQRTIVEVSREFTIGDETGLGGGSHVFTHASWSSELDGYPGRYAAVSIGAKVWTGWDIFICAGAKIGDFSIVRPGTIVEGTVPELSVASGDPMKIVSENGRHLRRFSDDQRWKLTGKFMEDLAAEVNGKLECTADRVTMSDGSQRVVLSRENGEPDVQRGDVWISWGRMNSGMAAMIESRGAAWFEMERRLASDSGPELHETVISVFSRRGTRFERIDAADCDEHPGVPLPVLPPLTPRA